PAPPQQADLALAPVPWRPLTVDADTDYLDLLAARYTWPALGGELELPAHGPIRRRLGPGPHRVAWEVPDLAALGGVLCVRAESAGGTAEACRIPTAAAVRLRPLPAPGLALPAGTPAWNGKPLFGRETRFSWTPFAGGVVRLELDAQFPSAEHPRIDVYTAETGAGWPELGALGVRFPSDFVSYDVVAVGLGPFATLDEAAGPGGLGAAAAAERQRASGIRLAATLSPTGAPPDEQVCGDVPNVQCDPPAPLCGCGPGCICATPCEMVKAALPSSFARIDRQLALHPGLAAAVGLRCLRDCADLRAFRAAYRRYGRQHPGFEANEPLPRIPSLDEVLGRARAP
ncbi:MAG TPA: hypothetical protein VHO06_19105, partial [Polyangia bacterium]|nr:hypothetical protein [Polyangia bacterium]